MPIPRTKYSLHVVPSPCKTTSLPLFCNLLPAVDHFAAGAGGGVGGAGGGGVGAAPHHFALPPPLQVPKHWPSVMHPDLLLHRPQLQLSSHEYPHEGPSNEPSLAWQLPGYPGTGEGGVGAGGVGAGGVGAGGVGVLPPHHFALLPPLQFVMHVVLDMHPALVLQTPQLQESSQLYPHPAHGEVASAVAHGKAKTSNAE